MKAWLTFCDISFPRTHDLVRLLDLSLAVFPAMEEHREKLADLTEFAVDVRYPEGLPEPSREEALGTLSMAEGIVDQIRQKVHEASSNPEEDRH